MNVRQLLRRVTPCSVVQWLRVLFVSGLVIWLLLGYGFSQVQVNVKAKANSTALSYLKAPASLKLAENHPLNQCYQIQALHTNAVGSLEKSNGSSEVDRVFTLDFAGNSPSGYIQQLQATGDFEWIEANGLIQITEAVVENVDDSSAQAALWFHDVIRTSEAWILGQGSPDVKIGILDTGLDYAHPEFNGKIAVKAAEDLNGNGRFDPWPDTVLIDGVPGDFNGIDEDGNGYSDDVIGYDFTDQPRSPFGGDYLFEDPDPLDDNDHGTLVAGITSAAPGGDFLSYGVAPGCQLVTLRAFAANGAGEDDDIARAIVYAADEGVDILNFSFGDIYPSQMMHEAIKYAYQKGVVMVASAGNGTGDNLHYPSNFPEVISVSASSLGSDGSSEFLWPLSSFGLTVDLCAPGSGILTTVVRDTSEDGTICGTGIFSGTSTAAPMVAGAIALLYSQRGTIAPAPVRGMLTGSADDIASSGWDHLTGAGRLNLPALLNTVGGSVARIEFPPNDFGTAQDSIDLVVTGLDPEFVAMHLEYQAGTFGDDDWIPILENVSEQVENQELGVWAVSALPDGEYTLRLRIDRSNGRTAEDRVRVVIDRSPPEIVIQESTPVWDNNARSFMVVYRNSDRGQTQIHFRSEGEVEYKTLNFDRITRNGYFVLGPDLIQGDSIEYFLQTSNESGISASTSPRKIAYSPLTISPLGYDTTEYSIPMGHYLAEPQDFDGDGLLEVVMSEYDEFLGFGRLMNYEYNGTQFSAMDSLGFKPVLIPKDVADTDQDGLLELLCSVNDSLYVLEQAANGLFPQVFSYENLDAGYFAARFGDADNDGQLEMLAKDLVDYRVFESAGDGQFSPERLLEDVSGNYIGSVAPKILVEDLDQDGRNELVYGDFDGDLLFYEYNPNDAAYELVQLDTSALTQSGSYLVSGDFDGDGIQELCVATHPSTNRNEFDFEYNAPYWKLRMFKAVANNSYTLIWEDHFFDLDTDNFNALSAGDVDGDNDDELIFSTYPRTYIFDYGPNGMEPDWFRFGDLTTHHWIADVNGNGINEIAIGRGDKALFWEKDLSYEGPDPVSSLRGYVAGPQTIQLSWDPALQADSYRIWRGEVTGGSIFISLLDSSSNRVYRDTSVQSGLTYLYVLESKAPGLNIVYSPFSNPVVLTPDSLGRLDSISAIGPQQLVLHFSVPVGGDANALPLFQLNGATAPNTLIASGDARQNLVLSFPDDFLPVNTLEIDTAFLDLNRRQLSPNSLLQNFTWEADTSQFAHFNRWEVTSSTQAQIWFNHAMDTSVLDLNKYSIYPAGNIRGLRFNDASQTSILVDVEGVVLGALGYPVSIELQGGQALNGFPMRRDRGNVATFSSFQDDLSQVYVYPNPYQGNDFFEGVRFANLVQQCSVTVYTADGRLVQELIENDGDGGLEWNLLNIAGERVAPGNYLYRVAAEGFEDVIGTFSILR